MKISKVKSGVAISLVAMLLMACPGVSKPSAEVSKYEGTFVSVTPVKVVGQKISLENPSYTNSANDKYTGEFIDGRTVTISPFFIAATEVSYGLWSDVRGWAKNNGYFLGMGENPGDPNCPVVKVEWQDVIIWCNAYTSMKVAKAKEAIKIAREKGLVITEEIKQASQMKPVYYDREGGEVLTDKNKVNNSIYMDKMAKGFRLPTSVEWEYAARYQGDDKTNAVKLGEAYFTKLDSLSGATANLENQQASDAVAWYSANSGGMVHPVAQKRPNYLGLYDMSGNVNEWLFTQDALPEKGVYEDPILPFVNARRLCRGGNWNSSQQYMPLGFLDYWTDDNENPNVGFRLVQSIK